MKNILISTGGTGGHVIPATILHEHLKNNFNVYMTSDDRGIQFLDKNKYNIEIINVPKISKNFFLLPFQILFLLILTFKSFFLLSVSFTNNKILISFFLISLSNSLTWTKT